MWLGQLAGGHDPHLRRVVLLTRRRFLPVAGYHAAMAVEYVGEIYNAAHPAAPIIVGDFELMKGWPGNIDGTSAGPAVIGERSPTGLVHCPQTMDHPVAVFRRGAEVWIVILALGAGTYLIRFSFLGLIGSRRLPEFVLRLLRYTPVALFPGIIAPPRISRRGGATTCPDDTIMIVFWREHRQFTVRNPICFCSTCNFPCQNRAKLSCPHP